MTTQPLRVIQVLDDLQVGGVREVVLDLLRGLDRERVVCSLVVLSDPPDDWDSLDIPEWVRVAFVPTAEPDDYTARAYLADALLLGRARRRYSEALHLIGTLTADVLHFHTSPRTLPLGLAAASEPRPRLVFTDHLVRLRASEHSGVARWLLRSAYRRMYRAYHLVSVGRGVADVHESLGLRGPGKRHLVLENRVDLERFHPPAEPRRGETVEFIYVARLHPVKGHDTLVQAFLQMETTVPCRLTLVGPDAMGGALHDLAASRPRAGREVTFLGVRSDVAELLRRASAGMFPSRREGKPLALMEMMASALPVAVSDIPELASLIRHGEDGLVVPVGDVAAWVDALETLARDGELRARLGRGARASMADLNGPDPAPIVERLYLEVAGRG